MDGKGRKWMALLLSLVLIGGSIFMADGTTLAAAKINYKKITLAAGQSKKLKVSGVKGKVTWKSSKKSVVTVNKKGKITAKKKGTAVITARTAGGKKFRCRVTVTKKKKAKSGKILVAYYSMPENVKTEGLDAITSASVLVQDGKTTGSVQYMAQIIGDNTGGDLFRIETEKKYPGKHSDLTEYASDELEKDTRPKLSTHVKDMAQYDVIFLGFPNWWFDVPRPVCSFLDGYDLSGKTIIPFCSHAGYDYSECIKTVKKLEPKADVTTKPFAANQDTYKKFESKIRAWLKEIGYKK